MGFVRDNGTNMSEKLSRSEQKRQFKQVEAAAREISELKDADLGKLNCSDELKQEIILSRKTKSGAKKRQIKFIAKLLQQEPLEEILLFLQDRKGSKLREDRYHHEAERMRDDIVDDALAAYEECRKFQEPWEIDWQSDALSETLRLLPGLDELEIRRSAHHYARSRNKSYYREIFRLIKAASEKKRLAMIQE